MASLYEQLPSRQYGELDKTEGVSIPEDNYKIFYLQAALELHKLPSVHRFLRSSEDTWDIKEGPLMAAFARYFAFFLMQRGVNQIHDQLKASTDPSQLGVETLRRSALVRTYTKLPDTKASSEDTVLAVTQQESKAIQAEFQDFVDEDRGEDLKYQYFNTLSKIVLYVKQLPPHSSPSHQNLNKRP